MAPTQMMTQVRPTAALVPASYGEMFQLAERMFKSKMFGVNSPEQAMVVLMTGLELGFSPAQAFRGIHVINNKPTLSADMMVAVCKARPDICHFFRMVETTDERATYETHRVGDPEPQRITFTSADAKRAGLLTNPTHQKYPAPMLRARASSGLARMVYSDLILGLYTPDEIESVPAPASSAAPERPVRAEDAIKTERKALVLSVSGLVNDLPEDEWHAWQDRLEMQYGVRLPHQMNIAQLQETETALKAKNWPHEAAFQDAMDRRKAKEQGPNAAPTLADHIEAGTDGEPDPFEEPAALLEVPATTKGHGDA